MIVSREMFAPCLEEIRKAKVFSLDTETTGLQPFTTSRLFSIAVATKTNAFYFNFNWYRDVGTRLLGREHLRAFAELLGGTDYYVFMHNAKYDMHIMAQDGIECAGTVHCTQAVGRLVDNDLMAYGLDVLARKYLGAEKDESLKKYLDANGCYTPAKDKGGKKDYHFWQAPLELITGYACQDARLTYDLGVDQLKRIRASDLAIATPTKSLARVLENELRLTKTLYRMEKRGILIDPDYTQKAFDYEVKKYKDAETKFFEVTGSDFIDSAKCLQPAFDKAGLSYGLTEKGNASFKEDALPSDSHPITDALLSRREAYKKAHSYYKNFLSLRDRNNVLHTDFRQSGAATGRMSAVSPALQTLPKFKEDTSENAEQFSIRRCFIPRDGYFFLVVDYDQMEYRMMLDYAGELEVIREIIEDKKDVHQAMADRVSITRTRAKTMNFLILYGGGIAKLATALLMEVMQAKALREDYFAKLPKVKNLIHSIINTAEKRGYVLNWMGRVYKFLDRFYAAPNYLIQGGCADLIKQVANICDEFLLDKKSALLLQVHDELVFEIHESEKHICPELVRIMSETYQHKHLQLTATPEVAYLSYADREKYVE